MQSMSVSSNFEVSQHSTFPTKVTDNSIECRSLPGRPLHLESYLKNHKGEEWVGGTECEQKTNIRAELMTLVMELISLVFIWGRSTQVLWQIRQEIIEYHSMFGLLL